MKNPIADRALEPILQEAAGDPQLLEGLLAGFNGREVEFMAARLEQPAWGRPDPWRQKVLAACAGLLWRRRLPVTVLRLLHLVGTIAPAQQWQQVALLEGLSSMPDRSPRTGSQRGRGPPRIVTLPTPPEALGALRNSPNTKLAAAAENLARQLNWPGKDGKPLPVPGPLTARQQTLYDLGHKEYLGLCAACHHASGYGDAGKGPPLLDSEWLDNPDRLIRMILCGVRGPITVNDVSFNPDGALEMPAMSKALDDEKIAGILTFIRREWRTGALPVETSTVARIRKETAGRSDPWTERELRELK